ncbi:hypothetical protein WJX72_002832 [[Myrmecia] bisecta]|uniref:F-box domain-containing protein n=1 Tax=[Myrmecia] bisecta TaxID=41462 RepID=A0AAW1Q686_9CHLO
MATSPAVQAPISSYVVRRPWLAMYGLRVRPGGFEENKALLAPIQKLLPEELLLLIFAKLPAYSLAGAQCVCQNWRTVGNNPELWKAACNEAFQLPNTASGIVTEAQEAKTLRLLRVMYRGSWKAMFLERPHLRFDGVYVSRNTYIRTGLVEWRVKNAAHLVCYYRYFRFFPDGQFVYRTSPDVVSKVAKSLHALPKRAKDSAVQKGRYKLEGDKLHTRMIYTNSCSTAIVTRLRLRSTVPGANNRLDVGSLFSFDQADGTESPLDGDGEHQDDYEDFQDPTRLRTHRRGLSPYVFVSWEHVNTSNLNLPVDKMDFYVAG